MKEPSFEIVHSIVGKVMNWFDNYYPIDLYLNDKYTYSTDSNDFNKWLRHRYVDPIINECCDSIGVSNTHELKPVVAQTLSILVARELNH